MNKRRNTPSVWPYVIVGSAVGGALACLFRTESGRKVRRSITHPDELAHNVEDARTFVESKARLATDRVRGVLDRAKEGIEEGQRAFREAEQKYHAGFQQRIERKNNEVAANVRKAVDNVSRTAYTVEQSVLEPLNEMAAIYRGIERGIRTAFGRKRAVRPDNIQPIYSDHGVS